MGVIDTEGKIYLSNNEIFADAFNYLLYRGEKVIKAFELKEIDTAQASAIFGNGKRSNIQKQRDLLKVWSAKSDENAIYVVLGAEIQDKVNYAMPVRNGLYDMLGYSKQIEEIKRSKKNSKAKMSAEEFLSGIGKDDKLVPIVTLVVYFGDDHWGGPKSLHEILDFSDDSLKEFVPDYKLNIISPFDMDEDEFERFNTDFGIALKIIKHQKDDVPAIINFNKDRFISNETAIFLNNIIKMDLEFESNSEGGVNMCESIERLKKQERIKGAIEAHKEHGLTDNDIIRMIISQYNVSEEYVLEMLNDLKE